MEGNGVVLLDSKVGRNIVKKHCKEQGIDISILEDLVTSELEQIGKLRKKGLFERFDEILDQNNE